MKKVNQKLVGLIIVGLIITLYCVFSSLQEEKTWQWYFSTISKIASILTIIISIFILYAWKWCMFGEWLVLIPNLNGEWQGDINSTWVNPKTGKSPDPIETKLTIKQNLFHISCVMTTGEMRSDSIVADIIIDREKQKTELHYNYISVPNAIVRNRSGIHYGAIIFEIHDNKLEGNYWTDRKTTGKIVLTKKLN